MDISKLHNDYQQFFPSSVLTRRKNKDTGEFIRITAPPRFYIAIDAEWYQSGQRNIVLSYQIATSFKDKTNNIIKLVSHGQRLKLVDLIELGIESVTDLAVENDSERDIEIILIAHNIVAEWSVLADRDEDYILDKIQLVRGLPVTTTRKINLKINKNIPVNVSIFDTILLAPTSHRSLKKLSTLLGDEGSLKDDITQHYITNMNLYLQDHPDRFRQYALKDSAITLALFFFLQTHLNELVKATSSVDEGSELKLYLTLASAGVKSFLRSCPGFPPYHKIIKDKFSKDLPLVKRSYYGGRNESFFVGRTSEHPQTRDKIWIDIDFSGCYPTALALVPTIDTEGASSHLRRAYKINNSEVLELQDNNISDQIIDTLQEALKRSVKDFDKTLMDLDFPDNKKYVIRQIVSQYDNTLIHKWQKEWEYIKSNKDLKGVGGYSIPGFARVTFEFPNDTEFPCLPVRHKEYGLIFPLQGETVVTAIEIMTALDAGASIQALTSIEFPVCIDTEGVPSRFALEHLKLMVKMRLEERRKDSAEGEAKQKLLKEFVNSLYGKFAQAINPKRNYNPSDGEYQHLPESPLTEPITASLTTSLARAALSSSLLAISRYNKGRDKADQLTVISATTDGFLLGVPTPTGYSVQTDYYDSNTDGTPRLKSHLVSDCLYDILKKFNHEEVVEYMDEYLAIRQMRYSRDLMTGNNEIFEVKHLADEIISVKTRGQIGLIDSGYAVLLARFGLKPPLSEIFKDNPERYKYLMDIGGIPRDTEDSKWIMDLLDKADETGDIEAYSFINLNRFVKIQKSQGDCDLTATVTKRNANMDFDWKRKLVEEGDDISPFSMPYIDLVEMLQHRSVMQSIRRTGKTAKPSEVLARQKVKGKVTRYRGGASQTIIRMFIRGYTQGKYNCDHILSYQETATKINSVCEKLNLLNVDVNPLTKTDLKNAARAKWEPGHYSPTPTSTVIIDELAKVFDIDSDLLMSLFFDSTRFKELNSFHIEKVVNLLTQGTKLGLFPLNDLKNKGLLPGAVQLKCFFRGQLEEKLLNTALHSPFINPRLPVKSLDSIKRILNMIGIPKGYINDCSKLICQSPEKVVKTRKNPSAKVCAEQFTHALMQADIANSGIYNKHFTDSLHRYGLTKSKCSKLRKDRFTPNSLKDTPSNRRQIRSMAKKFKHDPSELINILIARVR